MIFSKYKNIIGTKKNDKEKNTFVLNIKMIGIDWA